jgi:hypothetical protein
MNNGIFLLALLMLMDIETPPSGEKNSVGKPDPDFLVKLCCLRVIRVNPL